MNYQNVEGNENYDTLMNTFTRIMKVEGANIVLSTITVLMNVVFESQFYADNVVLLGTNKSSV